MSPTGGALVVRGASELGQAISEGLGELGYDVAVGFEQDDEAARQAVEAVEATGCQGFSLPGRVGDPMAAASLVDRADDRVDGLEVLVIGPRTQPVGEPSGVPDAAGAFLSADLGETEVALQADLKGPLVLMQHAAERMLEQDGGHVLAIAPPADLRRGADRTGARAAQAGLARIVEDAGRALAPEVTVNGLVPGPLAPEDADVEELEDPQAFVDTDEVGELAVQLATAPPALSGQTVATDGGRPDRGDLEPAGTREGEAEGLPGIEQRVEPPDPQDRIDVGEP